jgi:hypothetical protein
VVSLEYRIFKKLRSFGGWNGEGRFGPFFYK